MKKIRKKDGVNDAAFFSFNPKVAQAKSSRVTGVLSKSESLKPLPNGTLVFINANPDIQKVLDKVELGGGTIEVARRKIDTGSKKVEAGYVAIISRSLSNT